MGKKGKLSAALGATAGGLAWTLAVLLINRGLGWPDSWPTLVATGGLAFLASALVSGILRKPWAAHAGAVCALALLVACPLAGWPFRILPQQQKGYETRYAYFITYILGTEDNRPIENVRISYLAPNVDNWCPQEGGEFLLRPRWILYYLEDNGDLQPQVIFWRREVDRKWEIQVLQLCGERENPPEILDSGVALNDKGPHAVTFIDRLYPGEVLWEECEVEVPRSKTGRLTLRMAGQENLSGATLAMVPSLESLYYNPVPTQPFDKKVHVRFVSQLLRPLGENARERVEFYQREIEFYGNAGARLYPAS
jgi:hypothetical protein